MVVATGKQRFSLPHILPDKVSLTDVQPPHSISRSINLKYIYHSIGYHLLPNGTAFTLSHTLAQIRAKHVFSLLQDILFSLDDQQ